jgi:hypothetical protein
MFVYNFASNWNRFLQVSWTVFDDYGVFVCAIEIAVTLAMT